jgi:methylmalonyl-CoA mutase cobalamin-binding subunit
MSDMAGSKGTLVTGVIGEDVHIMGIRILEHALRDTGFRIVSLAQVSQEQYTGRKTDYQTVVEDLVQ